MKATWNQLAIAWSKFVDWLRALLGLAPRVPVVVPDPPIETDPTVIGPIK